MLRQAILSLVDTKHLYGACSICRCIRLKTYSQQLIYGFSGSSPTPVPPLRELSPLYCIKCLYFFANPEERNSIFFFQQGTVDWKKLNGKFYHNVNTPNTPTRQKWPGSDPGWLWPHGPEQLLWETPTRRGRAPCS